MDMLRTKVLVAALAIVSAVAVLAIIGLMSWSERAHESFRDEVVLVLAQRYHRVATAVPGDPDGIELGGRRRDLRNLFATATYLPEPARGDAIYSAFVGDTATVGRAIVNDEPFRGGDAQTATPPAFDTLVPPKRVKVLRVGPDGRTKR